MTDNNAGVNAGAVKTELISPAQLLTKSKFYAAKRNDCYVFSGKLIPAITLAKTLIANLAEHYRLTGYRIESVTIAGFKG